MDKIVLVCDHPIIEDLQRHLSRNYKVETVDDIDKLSYFQILELIEHCNSLGIDTPELSDTINTINSCNGSRIEQQRIEYLMDHSLGPQQGFKVFYIVVIPRLPKTFNLLEGDGLKVLSWLRLNRDKPHVICHIVEANVTDNEVISCRIFDKLRFVFLRYSDNSNKYGRINPFDLGELDTVIDEQFILEF